VVHLPIPSIRRTRGRCGRPDSRDHLSGCRTPVNGPTSGLGTRTARISLGELPRGLSNGARRDPGFPRVWRRWRPSTQPRLTGPPFLGSVQNNASEQTPMALQCRCHLRYRPGTPLAQLKLDTLCRSPARTTASTLGLSSTPRDSVSGFTRVRHASVRLSAPPATLTIGGDTEWPVLWAGALGWAALNLRWRQPGRRASIWP
jgi:hypothetical protein